MLRYLAPSVWVVSQCKWGAKYQHLPIAELLPTTNKNLKLTRNGIFQYKSFISFRYRHGSDILIGLTLTRVQSFATFCTISDGISSWYDVIKWFLFVPEFWFCLFYYYYSSISVVFELYIFVHLKFTVVHTGDSTGNRLMR